MTRRLGLITYKVMRNRTTNGSEVINRVHRILHLSHVDYEEALQVLSWNRDRGTVLTKAVFEKPLVRRRSNDSVHPRRWDQFRRRRKDHTITIGPYQARFRFIGRQNQMEIRFDLEFT